MGLELTMALTRAMGPVGRPTRIAPLWSGASKGGEY